MSDERAYFVVLETGGRMHPCKHKHDTREEADACVAAHDGLAIIEWVRGRNPQFAFPWVKDDLDGDGGDSGKKLRVFMERMN